MTNSEKAAYARERLKDARAALSHAPLLSMAWVEAQTDIATWSYNVCFWEREAKRELEITVTE